MTAGRSVNSQRQDWCTPPKYVAAVRLMFNDIVELDPCSNESSTVNAQIELALPKHDALVEEWNFHTIYVNPPYGADRERGTTIKNWLFKCADAHARFNSEVLALVPVAANTRHWKDFVWGSATSVCFLYDTRLKFIEQGGGREKGAPMACAMIYWGVNYERFFSIFMRFGAVVDLRPLHGERIGEQRGAPIQRQFEVRRLTIHSNGRRTGAA